MNLFVNYFAVSHLAEEATQDDFSDLFAPYGRVQGVYMLGQGARRSAVVKMAETRAAGKVIRERLNGRRWKGGALSIYLPLFFQE